MAQGAIIITDCWKFIQQVESTPKTSKEWSKVKSSMPKSGPRKGQIDGYLAVYRWKQFHSDRGMRLHDLYASTH
ncbi:hypothetical protein J437_LFUL010503 [Ladona fulva]|uniref:Uncharacterized protein n=1 Tax=Ladona fulva TaxID=123851 RepID=A0A8K0KC16_LADFU|nr:hypothetical protein J437_LFUL010503 [Ladona fulva]